MKSLSLAALILGAFGALTLSGCTACMPPAEEPAKKPKDPIITCGPGTIPSGTKCLGIK